MSVADNATECARCLKVPELETGNYPYEGYFRLRCLTCGERTQSYDELGKAVAEWNEMQDSEKSK